MTEHGTYTTIDGAPAVVFERRLRHPIDAVWEAITDPGELVRWFPCEIRLDPRVGGDVSYVYGPDASDSGRVLDAEPPSLLRFTWGRDILRFELEADGTGTRLRFTHVLHQEGAPAAAKVAAGWQICFDGLARLLDGVDAGVVPGLTPQWRRHYDWYVRHDVPSGAPVPGL